MCVEKRTAVSIYKIGWGGGEPTGGPPSIGPPDVGTRKNTLNCMFFVGFRSPSLYFCSMLYLKLNGKIVSLDKTITVEDIGLF